MTDPYRAMCAELAKEVEHLWSIVRDDNNEPHPLADRAAELLSQRHPTPVPVSERLPGPDDCDAEGRCWWGEPQIEDSHDATWNLCTQDDAKEFCTWGTKCGWLPANALPTPRHQ